MFKLRKRTEKVPKSIEDDQSSEQNEYDEYDGNNKKSNSSSDDNENENNDEYDEDNDNDKENDYEEEDNNDDDSNEEENNEYEENNDDDYENEDNNDDDYENEDNNDDTEGEKENDYSDNDDKEQVNNDEYDDSDKSSDNKYHKKKYNLHIIKSNDENYHTCYMKNSHHNKSHHFNSNSKQYKDHKNSYNAPKSYHSNTKYYSQQYGSNFHSKNPTYKNLNSHNSYKTTPKMFTHNCNKSGHYKMHGNSSSSSNGAKVINIYINGQSSNNNYKKNNFSYNLNSHHHSSHYNEKLDPYSDIYSNIDCSSNLIADVDKLEGRKKIAAQTCAIIQAGSYKVKKNNGSYATVNISAQIQNCIKYTRVYKPDFFITRDPTLNLTPHNMCKIKANRSSSYGVARKILKNDKTKKVCILNFASATKPGGGFIEGKNAQEESLCRQSALYASLYEKPEMYDAHNSDINHHYYSDYMIYSPDVPVIRDDIVEELLSEKEMYTTSVITSAAPYLKKIKEKSPNFETKYKKGYEKIILDRCRKIIMLAIYKKTDVLVLGSYGCGVFENDQKVVFGSFKTVLIDEGYGRYLDLVSFPKMNLNSLSGSIFKKAFKGYLS